MMTEGKHIKCVERKKEKWCEEKWRKYNKIL